MKQEPLSRQYHGPRVPVRRGFDPGRLRSLPNRQVPQNAPHGQKHAQVACREARPASILMQAANLQALRGGYRLNQVADRAIRCIVCTTNAQGVQPVFQCGRRNVVWAMTLMPAASAPSTAAPGISVSNAAPAFSNAPSSRGPSAVAKTPNAANALNQGSLN